MSRKKGSFGEYKHPDQKCSKHIGVTITPPELKLLEDRIRKLRMTKSDFLRGAIVHYLAHLETNHPGNANKLQSINKNS